MTVDEVLLRVTFQVVKERDIPYAAMIGNDVLKDVELVFREGSVEFRKPTKTAEMAVEKVVAGMATVGAQSSCVGAEVVVSVHAKASRPIDDQSKVFSKQTGDTKDTSCNKVDLAHLGECESKAVAKLINEYSPMKPVSTPMQMKLILTGDNPVHQRPRRVSHADRRYIDDLVASMLNKGIIQNSTSEYASPVVLTTKKNETKRFGCDFRKVHEKIFRDNFPMALVDEALDKLQGANIFTTLDLKKRILSRTSRTGLT
ncbi:PREDICTED: uncharacterized protein LOC108368073 [Rhagoletis zephyria]|uniref:uncharacterized protein LOC108368073 n=1 Tax=Rhagoletis zephyria TaxID=28612 RepID=UPI0008115FA8|nr:PREDICTED: uncharacterized protein LOC108368073 [Rhagoletis zephyria]